MRTAKCTPAPGPAAASLLGVGRAREMISVQSHSPTHLMKNNKHRSPSVRRARSEARMLLFLTVFGGLSLAGGPIAAAGSALPTTVRSGSK